MYRLLLILAAGLFLVLLIGGRDGGQTRLGLQGAYDIAALQDLPPPQEPEVAVEPATPPAAAPAAAPRPQPAPEPQETPGLDQMASAPAAPEPTAAADGLTLSLPLGTENVAAPVAPEAAPLGITARIVGSQVNLRDGPSARGAVLGRLARDQTVTIISTDTPGWTRVRIEADGTEGFVASRYLSDASSDSVLFPSESP